jgi:AraC family transcriptional activator of pobA
MSVHGFVFTPDSRGFILTCPEFALAEFLFLSAADAERLNRSAAVGNQPDREFARLESDFAALLEEFNGDRAARLQALRARALPVVLWFIRSLLQNEHAPASNGENRGIGLVNRFLGLVNAHFREQRPLSYYAGELRISGTHLNRLTRQHLGSTASAVICERVLLEAQRELAYTNRTVSAIAYALGYRDPAYFTRLFTRNVGMTPTAYRRKMEAL